MRAAGAAFARHGRIYNQSRHMGASNTPTTVAADEDRRDAEHRPVLAGVSVREDDIEPTKGIRRIAVLFRSMAILLLVLMALRVFFAFTSTVPASAGVVFAESVRLIIFAGLLWGFGDLAVLGIKSHYDIRANRILNARMAYSLQQIAKSLGAPQQDREK
jgi:hypothetical protein